MKLQVRIKQENEVKIKLRVKDRGQKWVGRRVEMVSHSFLTSSWRRGRMSMNGEFDSLNELIKEA